VHVIRIIPIMIISTIIIAFAYSSSKVGSCSKRKKNINRTCVCVIILLYAEVSARSIKKKNVKVFGERFVAPLEAEEVEFLTEPITLLLTKIKILIIALSVRKNLEKQITKIRRRRCHHRCRRFLLGV